LNNTDVSTFQALAPENNTILTRDTHPPFWFYIPFAGSDELRYAEFMLIHDEDQSYALGEPILFELPEQPGLVQVQLPESFSGLESDRLYRWYFSIQCDANELSRNPGLSGEIERSSQVVDQRDLWPEAMMQAMNNGPSNDWAEFLRNIKVNYQHPEEIVELEITR
ncbi:MAG: DUF928 domain-containing protein, partial [Cyanothece sp. SIO2G6]|nr:DUF928 domain-containing protein [Cyanothece sp. SIO2G6]